MESERFFIGFYKMLINRIFSRIKVSLLHSILGLQILHLLALLLQKRLFIERKINYFLADPTIIDSINITKGIEKVY